MTITTKSPLRLLADHISAAVTAIDSRFEAAGLPFPSLHEPYDVNHPSTAVLFEPDVAAQVAVIVGATEQLSVSVRPPTIVMMETAFSYQKAACLNIAEVGNVAEILREAGPKGLHAKQISKKNGINAEKLARVLRLLTSYHIFTEVEPDVFSNNRISSVLDTMKSTTELFSKSSDQKFVKAGGISAIVDIISGMHFKNAPFMVEAFTDPKWTNSYDERECAFNLAYKTNDDWWSWLTGDEKRNTTFVMAMDTTGRWDNEENVLQGFPWESLPDGAKVVDVGGGVGSASMKIASKHRHLKFVVQDSPHVISHAKQIWDLNLPGFVDSGRAVLQAHNFYTPQPVKDADIFFLRTIIHDWGHSYSVDILTQLRNAAVVGKTRLLLVDQVAKYSCKDTSLATREIEMPAQRPVPEGLLPSLGRASSMAYLFDTVMLAATNGEERTIGTWNEVTRQSGWKIVRVWAPQGSMHNHILAVPV